jgi:arylsulfatase A-like enzyme
LTQAFAGARTLSIRRGDWKYIDHAGSGGNRYDKDPALKRYAIPEKAPQAPGQLYNLARDPGESNNLYDQEPAIVAELSELLRRSVRSGRSR